LPFGWLSYRRYQRRSREPMGEGTRETMLPSPSTLASNLGRSNDQTDRPSRLN